MTPPPEGRRVSPRLVREASFTRRRRGVDESEVRGFLAELAEVIESGDAERARLRAEIDRLRQSQSGKSDETAINPQAIALFSQAQQVADNLVAEAVDHARSLMSETRKQQREMLEKAKTAVGQAIPDAEAVAREHGGTLREVEYVRTFAKVAQVQLRSVLEALTEQVERLGDVPDPPADSPRLEAGPVAPAATYGPVRWRFDRKADSAAAS